MAGQVHGDGIEPLFGEIAVEQGPHRMVETGAMNKDDARQAGLEILPAGRGIYDVIIQLDFHTTMVCRLFL